MIPSLKSSASRILVPGILALTLLPLSAVAGGGSTVGNGGQALLCENAPPVLLDYQEAIREHRFGIVFSEKSTLREKVEEVLGRIATLDPILIQRLQTHLRDLLKEVEATEALDLPATGMSEAQMDPVNEKLQILRVSYEPLPLILDSEEIVTYGGCRKQQLVVQWHPKYQSPFPRDRMYKIHWPTWLQLNADQRAMTLIHESVYRETLLLNAKDSRFARYFNGLIHSSKIGQLDLRTYGDELKIADRLGFHFPHEVNACNRREDLSRGSWIRHRDGRLLHQAGSNFFLTFVDDRTASVRLCKVSIRGLLSSYSSDRFANGKVSYGKANEPYVFAKWRKDRPVHSVEIYDASGRLRYGHFDTIKAITMNGVRHTNVDAYEVDEKGRLIRALKGYDSEWYRQFTDEHPGVETHPKS